jgi:threonine dehydrogenase-like Zn-dependent dehydrogenase
VNDWVETVKAMAAGKIKVEELVTHRYPISRCREALEMMHGRKEFYTKVTIINE